MFVDACRMSFDEPGSSLKRDIRTLSQSIDFCNIFLQRAAFDSEDLLPSRTGLEDMDGCSSENGASDLDESEEVEARDCKT